MVLTGEYEQYFRCSYDLLNYPFDTQQCTIDLSIPTTLKKSLKLKPGTAEYIGPVDLLQYQVQKIRLLSQGDRIKCRFHLKRNPSYHMTATYLPTFCILIMAMVTLYIDEAHFEATIMVALTAMLVMYTLFQSISADMPNTAYLKLLDYWLIFGLLMPFVVFIAEVILELTKYFSLDAKKFKLRRTIKLLIQVGIPLGSLIFMTVYVMKGLRVYQSE